MRGILLTGLLLLAAFSGCLGSDDGGDDFTIEDKNGLDVVQKALTNPTKHLAAHPAYGYPSFNDYSGFVGDAVPDAWVPPNATPIPDQITGLELAASAENVSSGAGIATFGHYAIVSGNGPGAIVDIADPLQPVKVADLEESVRDADIIAYPDGRLVAVLASNGPIWLYDITDPTDPVELGALEVSSHNAVVVPGTPIVYNAGSSGGADNSLFSPDAHAGEGVGVTEVFDLSDPTDPQRLDDFENGYGCHDITTFIDAENDKYRAYCAGIEMTQIWDITDPTQPEVIVNVPVHHGVAGTPSGSVPITLFSHLAMTNHDGTILIVGDETGGGQANACDVNTGVGVAGPTGNLWFYDITDETAPMLLSMYNPTNPATRPDYLMPIVDDVAAGEAPSAAACTAHFGRLVGDQDILAMSFYGAGVVLVDFTDPSMPTQIAQFAEGSDTWDVWEWQGYLFTGDLNRGLDVLKLV